MAIIMYSTNCPKCRVLETKLKQKNIQYQIVDNIEKMLELGIKEAPQLSVDGTMMGFGEAIKWVNGK